MPIVINEYDDGHFITVMFDSFLYPKIIAINGNGCHYKTTNRKGGRV